MSVKPDNHAGPRRRRSIASVGYAPQRRGRLDALCAVGLAMELLSAIAGFATLARQIELPIATLYSAAPGSTVNLYVESTISHFGGMVAVATCGLLSGFGALATRKHPRLLATAAIGPALALLGIGASDLVLRYIVWRHNLVVGG